MGGVLSKVTWDQGEKEVVLTKLGGISRYTVLWKFIMGEGEKPLSTPCCVRRSAESPDRDRVRII